jgi:hypothetical protein
MVILPSRRYHTVAVLGYSRSFHPIGAALLLHPTPRIPLPPFGSQLADYPRISRASVRPPGPE